jgi:RNA polymerase-binding transcription factor DksA
MATPKKVSKASAKKPAPKKANASKPAKKSAPVKKQAKPAVKKNNNNNKKPISAKSKVGTKSAIKKQVKPIAKVAKKAVANLKPNQGKTPMTKTTKPIQKPIPAKAATPVKTVSKAAIMKPVDDRKMHLKPVVKNPNAIKANAKNVKDIKVIPPKPVVIPKMATKTSRKYQPDFTKSVLDQPKNNPGAPIVRYSDADLLEFRELIQRKLEAAKKELTYLQGLITRKDEMGGDESENRYMTMEDGSLSMEREQLSQMASRQITFIDHLEKAIMRIENKTYGICRVTGKLIDKARLRAVPHATLSIEAKMGIVK